MNKSPQITYLENLLEGYKERYRRGEKDLYPRIQATSAQLDDLRLKEAYAEKPTKNLIQRLLPRRGCCGGR
jgi:hypothetical protein